MANLLPKQYSRWRKWREIIQIWGLVIPGIAGILISIASFFFSPKDLVLSALLFLFSILALAIGLERYDAIGEERIDAQRKHQEVLQTINQIQIAFKQENLNLGKEITEVHRTLTSAVTVKTLIGAEANYEEATRLIKSCSGSEVIRATSLEHFTKDENYSSSASISSTNTGYLETLAKVIGQGKLKKLGMVYKVIIGFHLTQKGNPPLSAQKAILKRRSLFRENNVLDRLEIKYLDVAWSLNILIIGNEHMILGFPIIASDESIRSGIRVTDKVFVTSMARWYDEYLWHNANDVKWSEVELQQ